MPRRSLLEYFENLHRFADDVAFVGRRGYRSDRWSYRRLGRLAAQVARELESRGIARGDRVLLWGANSAEWVAAFFGCMLRGAVVVPMDRIAAPDFARRVAPQVEARLAFCSREQMPHLASTLALELESLEQTLGSRDASFVEPVQLERTDTAEVLFTSGSTAEPKGVVLTHGNLLANLEPIEREIAEYRRYDRVFHPLRFLNVLPLSHVFGQMMGLWVPQLIGGTVVFQESLNPAEVLRAIRAERISVLVAVPRLLDSLKQQLEREAAAAGGEESFRKKLEAAAKQSALGRWWSFRRLHRRLGWKFWAVISGGATLDRALEEFWRRLGFAVIQGYGLTETTSLISLNHPFRMGRGSIGKVLPGREVRLDSSGEILVRGESVAAGYWRASALEPVLGEAGWFHTGDLGALDAEGNLYFKGRSKQVIVTSEGLNIHPEDLEAALRRQPEVRDCVVVGVSDAPCAVLLLRGDSADVAAVVARANASLVPHQQMRNWLVWPEHDLPRVTAGKVNTAAIQSYAEQKSTDAPATSPASGSLADLVAQVARRPSTTAEGALDLSSMERVELACALEDRYQVALDDARLADAETIADLEQALRHSLPRPETTIYPRWAERRPMPWLRRAFYYLAAWPATVLLAAPRVSGRENLRDVKGPVLVISNHVTYLDIGFILAALPARLRHPLAVAMGGEMLESLRRPPREVLFIRRWLDRFDYLLAVGLFNVFPLPQQAGYRQSFAYAGELADRGSSILIFPEGRRTPDGAMHAFRPGAGLLATRLRLPVVPMKIEGLYELKVRGSYAARPGAVRVKIGAPLTFEENEEPESVTAQLEAIVRAL